MALGDAHRHLQRVVQIITEYCTLALGLHLVFTLGIHPTRGTLLRLEGSPAHGHGTCIFAVLYCTVLHLHQQNWLRTSSLQFRTPSTIGPRPRVDVKCSEQSSFLILSVRCEIKRIRFESRRDLCMILWSAKPNSANACKPHQAPQVTTFDERNGSV